MIIVFVNIFHIRAYRKRTPFNYRKFVGKLPSNVSEHWLPNGKFSKFGNVLSITYNEPLIEKNFRLKFQCARHSTVDSKHQEFQTLKILNVILTYINVQVLELKFSGVHN